MGKFVDFLKDVGSAFSGSSIGGSLFGGFSSLLGAGINAMINGTRDQQREQEKADQKEMADYMAGINKDMAKYQDDLYRQQQRYLWDEFNSPEAMRKAYEKAGLHPSLAMGGGSGGSISGSMASGGVNGPNSIDPSNFGINNNPLLASEIAVNESIADRNQAEADRLRGQEGRDTEKHPLQLKAEKLANQFAELKNVEQGIKNSMEQVALEIANATKSLTVEEKRKSVQLLDRQIDKLVEETNTETYKQKQLDAETRLVEQQVMNAAWERALLEVEIRAKEQGILLDRAQIRESAVRVGLMTKQGDLIDAQTAVEVLRQRGVEIENANAIKEGKWIHYKNAVGFVKGLTSIMCDAAALATGMGGVKSVVDSARLPGLLGPDGSPITWTTVTRKSN